MPVAFATDDNAHVHFRLVWITQGLCVASKVVQDTSTHHPESSSYRGIFAFLVLCPPSAPRPNLSFTSEALIINILTSSSNRAPVSTPHLPAHPTHHRSHRTVSDHFIGHSHLASHVGATLLSSDTNFYVPSERPTSTCACPC